MSNSCGDEILGCSHGFWLRCLLTSVVLTGIDGCLQMLSPERYLRNAEIAAIKLALDQYSIPR